MRTELMQSGLNLARAAPPVAQATTVSRHAVPAGLAEPKERLTPEQASRLNSLKRMYWVHVAKAGTTFGNVLIKHAKICPGLSEDQVLTSDLWNQPNHNSIFFELSGEENCPGAFVFGYGFASHQGIGDLTDRERQGHGVIMLRQPEQRLISSFYDGQHDWPKEEPPATSFMQYAQGVTGCVVKMLSRGGGQREPCSEVGLPTDRELKMAKYRLEHDFGFVGLTEEWDLSVCLFHAKFGGACHDYELTDVNPGHHRSNTSELYDTAMLEGHVDAYDGQLYAMAEEIFSEDTTQLGVTAASCAAMCRA